MSEKFSWRSPEEIQRRGREVGVNLPMSSDTSICGMPLSVGELTLNNRLGIAPMEGADSLADGSPSELTLRRYVREAQGGAAVIWFEAISVVPEGRSSRTQLLLTRRNLDSFKRMTDAVKKAGIQANGFAPYLICQANHSGRYSNPDNKPAPLIAFRSPYLEQFRKADDSCIVSDDYLEALEERFGEGARLAKEAGFDAVDIKSCHGYLFAEVAAGFTRPGRYGGSYENRTRLLKNSIRAAKAYESPSFQIVSRIGIYDGYPYPYGFGMRDDKSLLPDYTEPKRLVQELYGDLGLRMICVTMGNPYVTTHVTRPFDRGKYVPAEHPLTGVGRMIEGTREIKRWVPGMKIWASAPTYLRQFSDLYTAGAIRQGYCDGMLFGRMAFADPDFPNQIIRAGRIDASKVCMTCGACGDLIRSHKPTGCVVRDGGTYLPYYREFLKEKNSLPKNFRG